MTSMDAQLAALRAALAKIARESFDPWAAKVALDALAATRPGA